MITTFFPPYNFGGDGIFVHRLSNELARRGHSVDVIHCIDSFNLLAEEKLSDASYDVHPNVTVHGLKSKFGILSPISTQQTGYPVFKTGRIKEVLKQDFDVIHYHNISLVGGPKILEYGKGIKIFTVHDYWLVCPTHALFRFNRYPCKTKLCFICSLSYKRPPQWWRYSNLLRFLEKHVDALISPSQFSKSVHLEMNLNIPIVQLPNFVPENEEYSQNTNNPPEPLPDKPFFLFAGRLEKLKGVHTIIPIFKDYRKAQLIIAGTGKYENSLMQLANGAQNIRFIGSLAYSQLRNWYKNAVAVIMPSLWFENFPLVVVEAFKEKTAVIARNIGSIPDIIGESNGGSVYNNNHELVSAMDKLLSDHQTRNRLGLNGYETYKKKWSIETHIENYLKLIYQLAESSSRLLN